MAIVIPKKQAPQDNSFWGNSGGLIKGISTIGGLVAAPFTGGASIAATQGFNAAMDQAHQANKSSDPTTGKAAPEAPVIQEQDGGAMGRRFQQEINNPSNQFLEAGSALDRMPPEIKAEYEPILMNAYKMSKSGGGRV